jgi:putative ABC transport system permease protein
MKSLTRGHLKAGLDSVRGTKWRNFWTMLGVIIGVASVITVVAIGEGIKQQIGGQIHKTSDIITVQPGAIHVSGGGNSTLSLLSGLNIKGTLSSNDVNTVAATPGVASTVPLSAATSKVSGNQSSYKDGLVIGTTAGMAEDFNQSMAYGTFLSAADVGSNSVVLGEQAAIDLFDEDVPLGQSVTIGGHQFTVEGVFNAFPTIPLSATADFNSAVFIPYDVAQTMSNGGSETYQILVHPKQASQTKQVVNAIQQQLLRAHGGQNDVTVLAASQNTANTNAVLDLLTRLIAGTAAISLLVGGIGIMNVMLVSVTERMHEIGIRKAVGATNRQILSQFVIEATMLSLSGGLIGIVIAILIDVGLRLATNLQPVISWQVVVLATVVSLLVGIVFGSVPALKAARKDPIEALRSE